MSDSLFDGKSFYGYPFWNMVNRMVVNTHFHSAYLTGLENLPESGTFLLVSNHSSRWDGPVVQYILNRRANYMVSPNEMKGIQKPAVLSVGAFPANPRLDLVGYATRQLSAGEPVVIFPEGNIFYDGVLRRFKPGAAKVIHACRKNNVDLKVVPLGIHYEHGARPRFVATVGRVIYHEISDILVYSEGKRESLTELTDLLRKRVIQSVEQSRSLSSSNNSQPVLAAL